MGCNRKNAKKFLGPTKKPFKERNLMFGNLVKFWENDQAENFSAYLSKVICSS